MELTREQARADETLKQAEHETNSEDGRHTERETETKQQGRPDDHACSQQLGQGEAAYALVRLAVSHFLVGLDSRSVRR